MKRVNIPFLCLSLLSLLLTACGDSTATSQPATTTKTATTTAAPTITTVSTTTTTPVNTLAATTTATASPTGELVVFAAASLTDPFNDIKADLEKTYPGLKITYNFAMAVQLRTQLEQGAKADIFASADTLQVDKAAEEGLTASPGTVFVRNRLVVILPKNNPARIEKLQDLSRPGLKFVSGMDDAPHTMYLMKVLDKMSQDQAFGSDFKTKVITNISSKEATIKQVLAKVQLGEGDVGSVFVSDITAKVSPELITIEIPDNYNVIADYALAPLKASPNPPATKAFLDYVLGEKGQTVFKKYNFILPIK